MTKIWILAANSERARIFEARERNGQLREIEDLIEPLAHRHNRDLITDAPGSQAGGNGAARHSVNGERDAKEQEHIRFAKRIAETLMSGRHKAGYDRLHIVADPSMLGWLREALDAPTRAKVSSEVSKNLVGQTPDEIRRHLPDFL